MKSQVLTVIVFLVLATGLTAQNDSPALDPALRARVLAEIAKGEAARDAASALHAACVIEHGGVELLLAELKRQRKEAKDASLLGARWLSAELRCLEGDLRGALRLFDALQKDADSPLLRLRRAEMLDALGRSAQAREAYEKALEGETPVAEATVRLRMALLQPGQKGKEDSELYTWAAGEGVDPALRNRAAIVLGFLGRPKEAIRLFRVDAPEGSLRFRQEIRIADWALEAKDWVAAREAASRAASTARLRRDRRYALSVLREAHQKEGSLDRLIERLSTEEGLGDDERELLIDLLRETGRLDKALELFRASGEGKFNASMRRELLEMCREAGREDELVSSYRELISTEPERIEWRAGLARHYLERGDRKAALQVWEPLRLTKDHLTLLTAAEACMGLGLDALALDFASYAEDRGGLIPALFFAFSLHLARGQVEEAEATLDRLDRAAAPEAPERLQLSEAWERLGQQRRAVDVLVKLRDARGAEGSGEDLEMRLAWLYSEIGDDEKALSCWRDLWSQVNSVPRRRYVEDRMMTVASRLGKLADIAIDLEERLEEGKAGDRESGLLVRLYTQVRDPVSAAEIIDEHLKQSGGDALKALKEKARVFLACLDYPNYEETLRQLIEKDPDGEPDYLRQLAMSQLERAKPREAREVLARLRDLQGGSDGLEFEAGVLGIAGMKKEAAVAYRQAIARYPDRIEVYLLLTKLMNEAGQRDEAIGLLQNLARTAERDDLFTVAIDGLLNLDATGGEMDFARRVILERIASRENKLYLYQLASDVFEQLKQPKRMISAINAALPAAGERRASLLRELMDMAQGQRKFQEQLRFGRRLLALGDLVPPQVYLELGEAFLKANDVLNAAKTFQLASDLPDYGSFQRKVAASFESAGYLAQARRIYERVLVGESGSASLIVRIGELHEQLGRDDLARGLYRQGLELVLSKRPVVNEKSETPTKEPVSYFNRKRNLDDYAQYYPRLLKGYLVVAASDADLDGFLARLEEGIDRDLTRADAGGLLASYPRAQARADLHRRLCVAFHRTERSCRLDLSLAKRLPEDPGLLEVMVKERLAWGLFGAARKLIDESGAKEEVKGPLNFLVGRGDPETLSGQVPVDQVVRLFLPLISAGERDAARALLKRLDLSETLKADLDQMPLLVSVASYLGENERTLSLARHWVRLLVRHGEARTLYAQMESLLTVCRLHLDAQQRKSLIRGLVDDVVANPKLGMALIYRLPNLLKAGGIEHLETNQAVVLLERQLEKSSYGLSPLLALVAPNEQATVLRRIWNRVDKSRRCQLILDLFRLTKSKMDEELGKFLVGSFPGAYADLENKASIGWYLEDAVAGPNYATAIGILEGIVKKVPSDITSRSYHAIALLRNGEKDAALAEAEEAYKLSLSAKANDWRAQSAVRSLRQRFLPDHLGLFLSVLDEEEKRAGESVALTKTRLQLVTDAGSKAEQIAAHRKAVKQHPKEVGFLRHLSGRLGSSGYHIEAARVLAEAAKLQPGSSSLQRSARNAWDSLRNPVRAAEFTKKKAKPAVKAAAKKEEERPEKIARATSKKVKTAVLASKWEEATTLWRRMWRRYPRPDARYFFDSDYLPVHYWPAEKKEEKPKDAPRERPRGGLPTGFVEAEKEEEKASTSERLSLAVALADRPFAEEEMKRQLRCGTPARLESKGALEIIKGLVKARVLRSSKQKVVDELVATLSEGRGGKLEYALLLGLLQDEPELAGDAVRPLIADLMKAVKPTDASSLRRLARLCAAKGERDQAARLYRWCALALSTERNSGNSVRDLVEEVERILEGDQRIEVIAQLLEANAPGESVWRRSSHEALVLDTWSRLLDPKAALERSRSICEAVRSPGPSTPANERPVPGTAMRAAVLYARAGDLDGALRCLEVVLAEPEKSDEEGEVISMSAISMIRLTSISGGTIFSSRARPRASRTLLRLFPAKLEGWVLGEKWFEGAADKLLFWAEAERLAGTEALQALAVLALRLQDHGDAERAKALLDLCEKKAADRPDLLLWVVDVARRGGDLERARRIEERLLSEGRLHPERVPEAVAGLATRDPAAAFAAGEKVGEFVLHPELTKQLIALATKLGKSERAAHWQKLHDECEALRAAAEAERKEAEKAR